METINAVLSGAHGDDMQEIARHLMTSLSYLEKALLIAAKPDARGDEEVGLKLMQEFMSLQMQTIANVAGDGDVSKLEADLPVDPGVVEFAHEFLDSKDMRDTAIASQRAAFNAHGTLHNKRLQHQLGSVKRMANDTTGKFAAMDAIKSEWKRRKDAGQKFKAIEFAREMAKAHSDVVTVEAIKNAQTRWNKEYHPAS